MYNCTGRTYISFVMKTMNNSSFAFSERKNKASVAFSSLFDIVGLLYLVKFTKGLALKKFDVHVERREVMRKVAQASYF